MIWAFMAESLCPGLGTPAGSRQGFNQSTLSSEAMATLIAHSPIKF
jgi:hypothetical protein